jgi:hypothetical protein
MTNRNLSRRLEKLEKQIAPNEVRHVIRVFYGNKDDPNPVYGYTVTRGGSYQETPTPTLKSRGR